jgi:hypothetical protein
MNTVYRRLTDDDIRWRSKDRIYTAYAIMAFLAIFIAISIGMALVYASRDTRIAIICFVVGGIVGISIGRNSK